MAALGNTGFIWRLRKTRTLKQRFGGLSQREQRRRRLGGNTVTAREAASNPLGHSDFRSPPTDTTSASISPSRRSARSRTSGRNCSLVSLFRGHGFRNGVSQFGKDLFQFPARCDGTAAPSHSKAQLLLRTLLWRKGCARPEPSF